MLVTRSRFLLTKTVRLLFISNLFPDMREPYRGLDNAAVLHALSSRWEIHTLALRPVLPWARKSWQPRADDVALRPTFVPTSYVPKFGTHWNHKLAANALRRHLDAARRDAHFDVVLCSWLFPDACAVARLQEEFHFRFVAIAQGSDVHQYLKMPARRKVMAKLLTRASAIITRSAELARLLGETGLRKDRLFPIYNGVDVAAFHPPTDTERAEARAAHKLPQSAPTILFVGNFLPIKNPHALLEAHARLRAIPELRETQLLLAGGGPLEAELRSRAEKLGHASGVHFTGRHDANGIARLMRAADVLALPSDNEGVPNVILEAFASGLPVVASRVGGIAEVHRHDYLGQLTPPRDVPALAAALQKTLLTPPDRKRIAEFGRTFTWQATADAYHRLLAQ